MPVEPALLSVRFGTGRSPSIADPARPADMLASLAEPDSMPGVFTVPPYAELAREQARIVEARRAQRKVDTSAMAERVKAMRRDVEHLLRLDLATTIARGIEGRSPLRERLVWFWSDHFTVALGGPPEKRLPVVAFSEEAIRPHVTGRFADMLAAAVKHPAMLRYLNQSASVGPNSSYARRHRRKGLNENLARELLELHTLGVGAAYQQADVRQLAELLAGLHEAPASGFAFLPHRGEPGTETVLGRQYGDRVPSLEDIEAVLEDLAVHPDTARHIARKLAIHFVADTPEPALVDALAQRFEETGGDLLAVTQVLLEHPASHVPERGKVRQPFDYMVAAFKGLGVPGTDLVAMGNRTLGRRLLNPLRAMGQPWRRAPGPDGWPEEAVHWVTPQSLASRIDWASRLASSQTDSIPDPREFVEAALGPLASERLRWAAAAAETRPEGVAIVLASPDFQRR